MLKKLNNIFIKKNSYNILFFIITIVYFIFTRFYIVSLHPAMLLEETGNFLRITENYNITNYGIDSRKALPTYAFLSRYTYEVINYIFFNLLGCSIFSFRFLSILSNGIICMILYKISKIIFNKAIANIVLLFSVIFPMSIVWSRNGIQYMFVLLIAICFFDNILQFFYRKKYKYLILSILFFIISLATHLFIAIFYIGLIPLAIFFLYIKLGKKLFLKIAGFIPVLIVLIFWVNPGVNRFVINMLIRFNTIFSEGLSATTGYEGTIFSLIFNKHITIIMDILSGRNSLIWIVGDVFSKYYSLIFISINVLLIILSFLFFKNIYSKISILLFSGILLIFIFCIIVGQFPKIYIFERYFVVVIPFYVLALSLALYNFLFVSNNKIFKNIGLIILIINILFYSVLFNYYYFVKPYKTGFNWRGHWVLNYSRVYPFNEYGSIEFAIDKYGNNLFSNVIKDIINDKSVAQKNKIILLNYYHESLTGFHLFLNDVNTDIKIMTDNRFYDIAYHFNFSKFNYQFVYENYSDHNIYIIEIPLEILPTGYGKGWRNLFPKNELNQVKLRKEYYDLNDVLRYNLFEYNFKSD